MTSISLLDMPEITIEITFIYPFLLFNTYSKFCIDNSRILKIDHGFENTDRVISTPMVFNKVKYRHYIVGRGNHTSFSGLETMIRFSRTTKIAIAKFESQFIRISDLRHSTSRTVAGCSRWKKKIECFQLCSMSITRSHRFDVIVEHLRDV